MNANWQSTLCGIALLLSANVKAGAPASDEPVADARSPADLNEAERSRMVGVANQYAACLATEASERSGSSKDPRVVADAAMTACDASYQAIGALLTELKLESGFAEGFIRTTHDRAARRLLTVLMEHQGQQP